MEIRISAKLFAEFVIGGPSKKSSTVRKLRQPRSPDAVIPSGYYKRAIGIIRGYHDRNNDYSFVTRELRALHEEVELALTAQARSKRRSNLQAVESYMRKFSSRQWRVVSCPKISYTSNDVRISGTPDLALKDADRIRLVKLGIRKEKEPEDLVRLMLRVIYQAAQKKLKLRSTDITYFDVATGNVISGCPEDRRLGVTIEGGFRVLQQMMHPVIE